MTAIEMKAIRAAQALAVLDALEGLVGKFSTVHVARDQHGTVVVRYTDEAEDALRAPESHRGASVRDALAQLTQAHMGEAAR
jgi:hypothetical protein